MVALKWKLDREIIIIKERLEIGFLVLIGVICSVLIHVPQVKYPSYCYKNWLDCSPPPPPAKLLSYTIIINPGLPQTPRKLLKRGRERSEKVRNHNYVDYKIQRIEKVRGSNQPISRERWRSYNYILMRKSGGNALNN